MITTLLSALLAFALSPTGLGLLVSGLGGILLALIRRSQKAARYESLFKDAVAIAYDVVNDIAAKTPNKIDDKVAVGLDVLRQYLGLHGVEATPVDEAKAKLLFQAMHGSEKAGA